VSENDNKQGVRTTINGCQHNKKYPAIPVNVAQYPIKPVSF